MVDLEGHPMKAVMKINKLDHNKSGHKRTNHMKAVMNGMMMIMIQMMLLKF